MRLENRRNRTYLFLKSLLAYLWHLACIFTSSKLIQKFFILDTDCKVDILQNPLFFNTFFQSAFDYHYMHFELLLGTFFFLENSYPVKHKTALLIYCLNMPPTLLRGNPNKDFFHLRSVIQQKFFNRIISCKNTYT